MDKFRIQMKIKELQDDDHVSHKLFPSMLFMHLSKYGIKKKVDGNGKFEITSSILKKN